KPPRAKMQSLSAKGAEAGTRGLRGLTECSTDYGRGRRRSTREPKRLAFPFEPRSENRGVHGILKAVALSEILRFGQTARCMVLVRCWRNGLAFSSCSRLGSTGCVGTR